MKSRQTTPRSKDQKPKLWQKTPFANLVRYLPSSIYFCRIRVRGVLIRRSLQTDVLSVAKLRLADEEKKQRHTADRQVAEQRGRGQMTFGEALAAYREGLAGNSEIKPKTKDYYEQRIDALLRTWPDLEKSNVRDLARKDCEDWAAKFKGSATAFNNTVLVLRSILDIGVERGVLYENVGRHVKRRTVKAKELHLPDNDQFAIFVAAIENAGGRFSRDCADLVRFLTFGGFRLGEAKNITWTDCDFGREEIVVRGDPVAGTKNSEIRRVPMIAEMRQLLERLRAEQREDAPAATVMRIAQCQVAMERATTKLGLSHLTHHDLRHLFATRCIESGVDIQTVSRWLGHKDGGALAMKVYGHLRNHHSQEMAKKVIFALPKAEPLVDGSSQPTTVKEPSTVKVRALKPRKGASPAPGTHRLAAENRPAS